MFNRHGRATGSIRFDSDELDLVIKDLAEQYAAEVKMVEPEPVDVAEVEQQVEPEPEPDIDWRREALDEYAAEHGLDTTDLPNKQAVLDAIRGNG